MDWSIIIAAAALAVSVLSPILTAIINHRYALKSKRIEFDEQHRIAALENFLRYAGGFSGGTGKHHAEFWSSCGEVYFYLPPDLWRYVDSLCELLPSHEYEKARLVFLELCQELAKRDLRPKLR